MMISSKLHLLTILLALLSFASPTAAESKRQIGPDVTPHVEVLGNPFRAKYLDGEWSFARNVWDMEVYEHRLYLGHGNSDNEFPASNAGPIEVWFYDASAGEFVNEYAVQEEQIERFRIINGVLLIPGHDPTDGGLGSLYYHTNGQWVRSQKIPNALHVYDVYLFGERVFVAKSPEAAVAVSNTFAGDWSEIEIPGAVQIPGMDTVSRAWEFFEVGEQLFLSVQMPLILTVPTPPHTPVPVVLDTPPVYRYDGTGFSAVETDFFPGYDELQYPLRIARSVKLFDQAVYIGAEVTSAHHWSPFGLFSVDPSLQVTQHVLQPDSVPWDILLQDDVLYVLTAAQDADRFNTTVSVLVTCDLLKWREVLHFTADTFARSFAMYDGDFYFGLGSSADSLSAATGNILRVKARHFDANC